jgi:hypothetical protein
MSPVAVTLGSDLVELRHSRDRIRQHTSAYVSIRQHTSAYAYLRRERLDHHLRFCLRLVERLLQLSHVLLHTVHLPKTKRSCCRIQYYMHFIRPKEPAKELHFPPNEPQSNLKKPPAPEKKCNSLARETTYPVCCRSMPILKHQPTIVL